MTHVTTPANKRLLKPLHSTWLKRCGAIGLSVALALACSPVAYATDGEESSEPISAESSVPSITADENDQTNANGSSSSAENENEDISTSSVEGLALLSTTSEAAVLSEGEASNDVTVLASGKSGTVDWTLTSDRTLTFSGTGAPRPGLSPAWVAAILKLEAGTVRVVVKEGVTSFPSNTFRNMTADYPMEMSLCSTLVTVSTSAIPAAAAIKSIERNDCPIYHDEMLYSNVADGVIVRSIVTSGDIVIPDGTKRVETFAFSGTSYKSLTIPGSLTYIDRLSFSADQSLYGVALFDSISINGESSFFRIESDSAAESYGCLCSKKSDYVYLEVRMSTVTDDSGVKYSVDYKKLVEAPSTLAGTYTVDSRCALIFGRAFADCVELEAVTGANVVSINSGAFRNCSKLKSASFDNVATIGTNAFYGCSGLVGFSASSSLKELGDSCFSACSTLQRVDLSSAKDLDTIPSYAFLNCSNLSSVYLPSGITTIKKQAFKKCTSLAAIDYSKFSLTSIETEAYSGCTSLVSIKLPSSVVLGENNYPTGGVFYGCTALQYVDISNLTATKLSNSLFAGCANLEMIKLPASLKELGNYVFQGCGFASFTIPNGITKVGDSAFLNCSKLSSVTLPLELTTLGSNVFANCVNLSGVTLPDGVVDIGCSAFANTGITSLALPAGLWLDRDRSWFSSDSAGLWPNARALFMSEGAALVGNSSTPTNWSSVSTLDLSKYQQSYLAPYMFMGLNQLAEVSIPRTVQVIDSGAFFGDTALKDVYCFGQSVSIAGAGTTGDPTLGWTADTYAAFSSWVIAEGETKATVKSMEGLNLYGLAYASNQLIEYAETNNCNFIPFAVLDGADTESLFGFEVTGYNNISISDMNWTGSALTPEVRVSFTDRDGVADRILENGSGCTMTYKDASGNAVDSVVAPGTYSVHIEGDNKSVFGTKDLTFVVNAPAEAELPVIGDASGVQASGAIWGEGVTEAQDSNLEAHTQEVKVTKILSGSDYDAIVANVGSGILAGVFQVDLLIDGTSVSDRFGSLTVSFPIDAAYDGTWVTVHHVHKNGTVTSERVLAANGSAVVTVTDLSTFGIEVGSSDSSTVTAISADQSATVKTGDSVSVWPLAFAGAAALVVLIVTMLRRKTNR